MHHCSLFSGKKGQTQSLVCILHICIIDNTYPIHIWGSYQSYFIFILCISCADSVTLLRNYNKYFLKENRLADSKISTRKTVCPICTDCAVNILPMTVSRNLYSYFFISYLCTKSVTPITLRLSKNHVTELEYVSYENRCQNQTLTKKRHVKNSVSYLKWQHITFVSCHEPHIQWKAIPYQV